MYSRGPSLDPRTPCAVNSQGPGTRGGNQGGPSGGYFGAGGKGPPWYPRSTATAPPEYSGAGRGGSTAPTQGYQGQRLIRGPGGYFGSEEGYNGLDRGGVSPGNSNQERGSNQRQERGSHPAEERGSHPKNQRGLPPGPEGGMSSSDTSSFSGGWDGSKKIKIENSHVQQSRTIFRHHSKEELVYAVFSSVADPDPRFRFCKIGSGSYLDICLFGFEQTTFLWHFFT